MGIMIEQGGALTTVQDEGRFGYQQYGVSPAGPMDYHSFHLANILAGNRREEAALEVTYLGPTLRFTEADVIAVAGGDLGFQINGKNAPRCQAVAVEKGDVISFSGMKNGCRAYVAFSGGLDVPLVMGSRSTLCRNHIGGLDGRKLERGDYIAFLAPKAALPGMKFRKTEAESFPEKEVVLRVVLGPQENEFTRRGIRRFFWYGGVISNEFDRMGCRLECEPIEHSGDGNIISDGISFGSVQIPSDGKPIIMLCDRQSTGGYAKIGTVITVDLPKLAQCAPGCRVRFVEVSLELAQELYVREIRAFDRLEVRLGQMSG